MIHNLGIRIFVIMSSDYLYILHHYLHNEQTLQDLLSHNNK